MPLPQPRRGASGEERAPPPGPPPPAPVVPPTSPHLPGLYLDGLSLQPSSTPALLTRYTSLFCGAAAPVCFPPCHICDKRSLLSALTVSLPVSPPQLGHPVFAFAEAATKFH